MLQETRTTRLVKGQDLNHHGTLFAGRMAEWFTESCFLAALRFVRRPEDIVCANIHGLRFTKPARPGDSVEIISNVVRCGTKSLTVSGEVFVNDEPDPTIHGFATFVTVDHDGRSYAHGLSLPPEWIAANRKLCEEAEELFTKR